MTPKEKALDLYDSLSCECDLETPHSNTKKFAMVVVDEILENVLPDTWGRIPNIGELKDYIPYQYWQEVKSEIEKL